MNVQISTISYVYLLHFWSKNHVFGLILTRKPIWVTGAGTGAGCPEKPQGNPQYSLIGLDIGYVRGHYIGIHIHLLTPSRPLTSNGT